MANFDEVFTTVLKIELGEGLYVPFIFVGVDATSWAASSVPEFVSKLSLPVVFAEWEYEHYAGMNSPEEQEYQSFIKSGCSIGPYNTTRSGTASLFLEIDANKIVGVSCGHVLDKVGDRVCQPSQYDFRVFKNGLQTRKTYLEQELNAVPSPLQPKVPHLNLEIALIQTKLDTVPYDSSEPRLTVGKVIMTKMGFGDWNGVERNIDVASFSVSTDRAPIPTPWAGNPTNWQERFRGKQVWEAAKEIEEPELDMLVRKTGRTTGTTFGMIGGVKGAMKSELWSWRGMDEFWVIREQPPKHSLLGGLRIGAIRGVQL
jgi:hypothetical protein